MVNPIFERTDRQAAHPAVFSRLYPDRQASLTTCSALSSVRRWRPVPPRCRESLPRSVRLEHELAQTEFSFRNIHFPDSPESLDLARRRLTFEELFYLSTGLAMLKHRRGDAAGGWCHPARWRNFSLCSPSPPPRPSAG